MGMLSTVQLTAVLDKITRYGGEVVGDQQLNPAFTAGMQKATSDCLQGAGGLATYLLTIVDEDVLADLLPAARTLDEDPPVPTDLTLTSLKKVMAFFTGLDAHYKHFGYASLDAYLTSLNGTTGMTPTLRAHQHCRRYFGRPSALNVFTPVDLPICTYTIGAGTPLSSLASLSKSTSGGAKFVTRNLGALAGPVTLSMVLIRIDGTTETVTVTIAVLTDAHETVLSSTSKLYADVQSISVTANGTAGDRFQVVAKTDRDIAAA